MISLNLDAPLKRLREGGAWAGNDVQDSLFAGSVSSDRTRRAQYEHYRDRLLSFPEKAVSGSDAS